MRVVVSAASRHGATIEIAEAIAAGLQRRGVDAVAVPIEQLHDVAGYDAAVIGSAVYYGRWMPAAQQLVERNAEALAARPVWLFSSGPVGPPGERVPKPGAEIDVSALLEAVHPVEHRLLAGKLDVEKLNFRERAVSRLIGTPVGDFRDWTEIDAFAAGIAAHLGAGLSLVAAR